jgi:hypothetical protein
MVLKNDALFSQLALLNSVDDAIESAPKDRKRPASDTGLRSPRSAPEASTNSLQYLDRFERMFGLDFGMHQ